MSKENCEQQGYVPAFACLLFLSGACALIYQVVWIRELRLVFGATTSASAAVLAIFMGGLGVGNAVLGRIIDRVLNPIRLYAIFETGIAVIAAVSPFLIDLTRSMYVMLGGQTTLGFGVATAFRLLAAVLVLAAPTFLMGGTLPAAARAVSKESDERRRGVALLYGLNTLGAVAGAGLANFVLLESLGNRGALWTACLINLALAAIAFKYSRFLMTLPIADQRRARRSAATIVSAAIETDPNLGQTPTRSLSLVYIASGMMGLAFFFMELVWYRMLGPLLGGTTYTFGLILCIALLGIGLGGAMYNLVSRWIRPSMQLLSLTCGLEALFIAIPFWFGDSIAIWAFRQQMVSVSTFGDQVWNWFQIGAFVILPASLVAGFQFPLLIAIAGSGRENVGKHVGWTFAANTLGAICGSLAGGFVLLPILTAPGLWQTVVIVLLALAVVIAVSSGRWRHPMIGASAGCCVLAVLAILSQGPTAAWRHSGIGAGRAQIVERGRNAEQDFINTQRRQCVWEAEGIETSVGMTLTDSIAFIVNGKSDGNAYSDAGTQIGLGLIGPFLHSSPKNGLVIGLGTGESVGWMADCDGIESVDVIELEPTIAVIASHCAAVNRDALKNPKVHLHYNDAREYLLTTDKTYDLIVSEPSNPYRAGVANLYTQEYYQAAMDRLSSDGIFVQWLQGYEVNDETVMIVLKTLQSVFPNLQIWRTRARDMMLICSPSDRAFNYDESFLRDRLSQSETIREGFQLAWRVNDIEGILAHFVCGQRTIDDWTDGHKIPFNTDSRNLLEYAFAKTLGKSELFSVQNLSARARRINDSLPVHLTNIDVETVENRRLAMHLYLGGEIPPDVQTRAKAYDHYLASRYSDAIKAFSAIKVDVACPIERLVYAHSLAETGGEIPPHVIEELQKENRTEAIALQAISNFSQNQFEAAVDDVVGTFESLRESPWASPQLLDSVLRISAALAQKDKEAAIVLYKSLEEPFALFRIEDKRLLSRYIVAGNIGNRQMIDALSTFEPNVPWKGWLLEERAMLYANEKHWLSDRARIELERFRLWSNSSQN